jgi:hypothetical protein
LKNWDEAYAANEFVYGTEPNEFYKSVIDTMSPGRALFPADGESRNGVYAATLGWEVDAFDQSEVAKQKARRFAAERRCTLRYWVADFSNPGVAPELYDLIVLSYLHVPKLTFHQGADCLVAALKPQGKLVAEVFAADHLKLKRPYGPDNPELLYTTANFKSAFPALQFEVLKQVSVELSHGRHHGSGIVIRAIGTKI